MRFDPATIAVMAIREEANYGGLRVRLVGLLGTSRCQLQLDVAFGDVVIPGPLEAELPTLLDGCPHHDCVSIPERQLWPRSLRQLSALEWRTAA